MKRVLKEVASRFWVLTMVLGVTAFGRAIDSKNFDMGLVSLGVILLTLHVLTDHHMMVQDMIGILTEDREESKKIFQELINRITQKKKVE